MAQPELGLWAAVEAVDHLLDVLDPLERTGGRTDGLDWRTGRPAHHRAEGRPGGGVRREPRALHSLQAGDRGRAEVGVGRGQERVLLGGQGELGLHHQGVEARGEARGDSLLVEELVVEAEVGVEGRRWSGESGLRTWRGLARSRLLLLDERTDIEGSEGLDWSVLTRVLLRLDGINLVCGLTDTIRLSISSLSCN